jgi:hypothetical protein
VFDRYRIGFSRGEVPITAAAALCEALAIVTGSLKHSYIRAMWQVSQHSRKHNRPVVLESTLGALADIRDMGHAPAVCKALIGAEAMIRRLDSGKFPDCAALLEISTARNESISACRRIA